MAAADSGPPLPTGDGAYDLIRRADREMASGRADQARRLLHVVLAAFPAEIEPLRKLGIVEYFRDAFEASLASLDRALLLDAGGRRVAPLRAHHIDLVTQRAYQERGLGRYERALELIRLAERRDPGNADVRYFLTGEHGAPPVEDEAAADPVFALFERTPAFETAPGSSRGEGDVDPFGVFTRASLDERQGRLRYASGRTSASPGGRLPPAGVEDLLEWIVLLEAVAAAGDRFVMVELGAGYGRWSVAAVAAARRLRRARRPTPRIVAVEAHSARYASIAVHMADNGINPADHRLIHAAIGAERGGVLFPERDLVGAGDPEKNFSAAVDPLRLTDQVRPDVNELTVGQNGRTLAVMRRVPRVVLADVAAGEGIIDLIHMDVQGAEGEAIPAAVETLNAVVRRLHVATHSRGVEETIRRTMAAQGWTNLIDLPHGGLEPAPTRWGPVRLGDGMQTWINPRLL